MEIRFIFEMKCTMIIIVSGFFLCCLDVVHECFFLFAASLNFVKINEHSLTYRYSIYCGRVPHTLYSWKPHWIANCKLRLFWIYIRRLADGHGLKICGLLWQHIKIETRIKNKKTLNLWLLQIHLTTNSSLGYKWHSADPMMENESHIHTYR